MVPALPDSRELKLYKMSMIFQLLRDNFGGLATWEDWVDFYMIMFEMRFRKKKSLIDSLDTEPEIHPHSFNDLVHKSTLLFQSLHPIRLAMEEGQKRAISSVCSLIGYSPTNEVIFHGCNTKEEDPELEGFGANQNLNKETSEVDHKVENTAQQATFTVLVFRTDSGEELTKSMIVCAREQSKRWAVANNSDEKRDWHQIVTELCTNQSLKQIVVPHMIDLEIDDEDDRLSLDHFFQWARNVRVHVLKLLYDKEKYVQCFKDHLQLGQTIVENADDFVKHCMYRAIAKKSKRRGHNSAAVANQVRLDKKELHKDGGIYLLRPPSPEMAHLIATMFSFFASGSRTSVEAISKLASLNGKRVTEPRFKQDIEFLEIEKSFKVDVSGIYEQDENVVISF
jgi:hypothetical protein